MLYSHTHRCNLDRGEKSALAGGKGESHAHRRRYNRGQADRVYREEGQTAKYDSRSVPKSKIRELKEKEIREDSLSRDQLELIANDLHLGGRVKRDPFH